MRRSIYKVPEGKLIKISLEEMQGSIQSISITGDFFMHPEEVLEKLEHTLIGCAMDENSLRARLHDFFHQEPVQLFGLDQDSLIHSILITQ